MKRVVLFLMICISLGVQVIAQDLIFKDESLSVVLASLNDAQTEYTIHFIANDLEHLRVSARFKSKNARKAVERVCKGQPVKVKTKGKNIFVQYKPEKDFSGKKIHLSGEVRDGFLDMPLLFEKGYDRFCDAVWTVWLPLDLQLSRLMARDGFTQEEAMSRIRSVLSG